MSPVDFTGGPNASVDLGGGSHGQVLRVTADDNSCRWNGFPVYMWACAFVPATPSSAYASVLKTDPLILPVSGASTAADWPPLYIADALEAVLSGYKLQVRLRGTYSTPGAFGNARVTNEATGLCVSDTEDAGGPFTIDTGYQNCSPSCAQMASIGHDWLRISPTLSNGSLGSAWTFTRWRIDTQWVSSGVTPADFCPDQDLFVSFVPWCDPDPGLYIRLATDSCGVLTKTYGQVVTAINSIGVGLTASSLGGHGGDIATPDATCVSDGVAVDCCSGSEMIDACEMSGADCSGAVDTDEGN